MSNVISSCPKCGKNGIIRPYHPRNTTKSSTRTEYYIAHEQLYHKKPWGTNSYQRVTPIRRCFIQKAHHRRQVEDIVNGTVLR